MSLSILRLYGLQAVKMGDELPHCEIASSFFFFFSTVFQGPHQHSGDAAVVLLATSPLVSISITKFIFKQCYAAFHLPEAMNTQTSNRDASVKDTIIIRV